MEPLGNVNLIYRMSRLWILGAFIWILTICVWLSAPEYIPFRVITLTPGQFSYRAWWPAAIGALLLSMFMVRHGVNAVFNGGYAYKMSVGAKVYRDRGVFIVRTHRGEKKFSTFLVRPVY